ncbi:helix-turn-helix transcriptional regulator [Candidatus Acetothermia bacterium]|nr:helix-turn-helix transcriptional regulator [Candidatus Acetothermia bacterium]
MHKVKELRERQGLSLKDVEAISGVDGSLINRIENGKVTPRVDTVVKLARALGVSAGELLVDYEREFAVT